MLFSCFFVKVFFRLSVEATYRCKSVTPNRPVFFYQTGCITHFSVRDNCSALMIKQDILAYEFAKYCSVTTIKSFDKYNAILFDILDLLMNWPVAFFIGVNPF